MPFRNWLSKPPVGVGLAVVLLLAGAGLAERYHYTGDEAQKAAHQGEAKASVEQPSAYVVGADIAANNGTDATANKHNDNPQPSPAGRDWWPQFTPGDTYAQWIMALFTVGATLVSIWAVILVNRTLGENRKATKAAIDAAKAARDSVEVDRKIGEAQVRAYLSCVGAEYTVHRDYLQVEPILFNSGQSPAQHIRVSGGVSVTSDKTYRSARVEGHCEAIPAGERRKGFILWLHTNFEPDVFTLISTLEFEFAVLGDLTWTDVFDQENTATFVLQHDRNKGSAIDGKEGSYLPAGTMTAFNRSGGWGEEA